MYADPIMEKAWMFIGRMPRRATPRNTSSEAMRSRAVTGPGESGKLFVKSIAIAETGAIVSHAHC